MSALNGRRSIEIRCIDRRGFVDYEDVGFYNRDGDPIDVFDYDGNQLSSRIPVVFRWACRDRRCSDRTPGMATVHRQTLYGEQDGRSVGEIATRDEPMRPLGELIDLLPPEKVRRIGPR